MDQEHTALDAVSQRIRPVLATIADGGEKVLGERPTMEHVLLVLFLITGVYMYLGASEFAPAAQRFPQLMAGATVVFSVLLLARNYLTVVGPLAGALLGGYFAYVGGSAFVDTGDGLFYLISGVVLFVVAIVFRERFGAAVESFVAEPVQVMGGDDSQPKQTDEDADTTLEEEPESDADSTEERTADTSESKTDEEAESEDEGSAAMYVYEIDDPRGPIVTGALCTVYMLLTFSIGMLYATPIFVALWTLWVRMDVLKAVAMVVLSFMISQAFYDFVERDVARGWLTGWQPPTPADLLSVSPHTNLFPHAIELLQWGVLLG
ncbi:hypothetical protein [Natronorubrum texcoconense]|uniref:Tripartite tricarboxylate transporter TctB family protein n=1 Tax=Natronorubrum texcoconense TaxID=1095776 RepID=A0A1G9H004_9EURY|nr:hypothetical protein [Natronorubrum texcoconense]SDL06174.1 hypothetical protein SAMN04515672_0081 [Natronorubrum texcoconense]